MTDLKELFASRFGLELEQYARHLKSSPGQKSLWDDSKHPHAPAGSPAGGQFVSSPTVGTSGNSDGLPESGGQQDKGDGLPTGGGVSSASEKLPESPKHPWQMTKGEFLKQSAVDPKQDAAEQKAARNLFAAAEAKGFTEGGEMARLTPQEVKKALKGTGLDAEHFKTGLAGHAKLSDGSGMYSGQLILRKQPSRAEAGHASEVYDALVAGKDVPSEVMEDYPELEQFRKKPEPPSKPKPSGGIRDYLDASKYPTKAEYVDAEVERLKGILPDDHEETLRAQAEMWADSRWKAPKAKGKFDVDQTVHVGGQPYSYRGSFTGEDGVKMAVVAGGSMGQMSVPFEQVEHAPEKHSALTAGFTRALYAAGCGGEVLDQYARRHLKSSPGQKGLWGTEQEELHPRAAKGEHGGEFVKKGGGGSAAPDPAPAAPKPKQPSDQDRVKAPAPKEPPSGSREERELHLTRAKIEELQQQLEKWEAAREDWKTRTYKKNAGRIDKKDEFGEIAGTQRIDRANERRRASAISTLNQSIMDNEKLIRTLLKRAHELDSGIKERQGEEAEQKRMRDSGVTTENFLEKGLDPETRKAMEELLGIGSKPKTESKSVRPHVTDTPEFKRWFAGSAVVDEHGKPLVVYHGTRKSFDKFDKSKFGEFDDGWLGDGFYFADTPEGAEDYTRSDSSRLKRQSAEGGNILPVYLRIENPAIIDENSDWMKLRGETTAAKFSAELKAKGHDGVIFRGPQSPSGMSDNQFMVLTPNQVKSATGNSGTFDPDDARINYAASQFAEQCVERYARRHVKSSPGQGSLEARFARAMYAAQFAECFVERYARRHLKSSPGQKSLWTDEDEQKHPRGGKGSEHGGEFVKKGTGSEHGIQEGHEFKVAPGVSNGGTHRDVPVRINKIDENGAHVGYGDAPELDYKSEGHVRKVVPHESLKHFVNDLQGKVDVPEHKDARINAVSSGKAKFLGKGDDGMAFDVGDHVVKVSTVVGYHWSNPGIRTPQGASDQLRDQVANNNAMREAGIPGLLPMEFVQHGDKGFAIMDKLEIPEKWTEKQLNQIKAVVDSMHEHGYSMNDELQFGLGKDGNVYAFDTGKAGKIRDGQAGEWDKDDDKGRVRRLFKDNGQENPYESEEAFIRYDGWHERTMRKLESGKEMSPGVAAMISKQGTEFYDAMEKHDPAMHEFFAEPHQALMDKLDGIAGKAKAAEIPVGTKAIEREVGTWTPEQRTADWKKNGVHGASFKAWFGDFEHDAANASKVVDQDTREPKETAPISGQASKVVKDGKPVTVYHGTPTGGFGAFEKRWGQATGANSSENLLYGPGFYFTEDQSVASEYANKDRKYPFTNPQIVDLIPDIEELVKTNELANREIGESVRRGLNSPGASHMRRGDVVRFFQEHQSDPEIRKWIESHGAEVDDSGEVKTVFLNIRKPFDVESDRIPATEAMKAHLREYIPQFDKAGDTDEAAKWRDSLNNGYDYDTALGMFASHPQGSKAGLQEHLKSLGYDGITHTGGRIMGTKEHRVWIAFEPTQIKSTDNEGTFDPGDDRMKYAQREVPETQVELFTALLGYRLEVDRYAKWKEQEHPHKPKGSPEGGQFAPKGQGGDGPAKPRDIGELMKVWDERGIENWLHEKNGVITLSKIVIPKSQRGKGLGSQAIDELVEYADRTGQKIALTPSSDYGGSKSRLQAFYRRFGFEKNKNYSIREAMVRHPAENPERSNYTASFSMLLDRYAKRYRSSPGQMGLFDEHKVHRAPKGSEHGGEFTSGGGAGGGLGDKPAGAVPGNAEGVSGTGRTDTGTHDPEHGDTGAPVQRKHGGLEGHGLKQGDAARAKKELLGEHEVSIAGDSYFGSTESVDRLVSQYLERFPKQSVESVRKAANELAKTKHRAPEEHWEAARGGVFTHNHPTGSAALSPGDVKAAKERGIRLMRVVSPRDGVVSVSMPADGWPDSTPKFSSLQEHDEFWKGIGSEVNRSSVEEAFGESPSEPSGGENERLVARFQSGDKSALNELIAKSQGLIGSQVKRWARTPTDFEDLQQEGNIALMKAAKKYDPEWGTAFASYATSAVYRAVSRAAKTLRKGQARGGIDEAAPDPVQSPDESPLERSEIKRKVLAVVEQLPPKSADVVRRRFGIGRDAQSAAEIAADMGVSRQAVHNVLNKAAEAMRESYGPDSYAARFMCLVEKYGIGSVLKGLAAKWDESKHKRGGKGSETGGQFVSKGGVSSQRTDSGHTKPSKGLPPVQPSRGPHPGTLQTNRDYSTIPDVFKPEQEAAPKPKPQPSKKAGQKPVDKARQQGRESVDKTLNRVLSNETLPSKAYDAAAETIDKLHDDDYIQMMADRLLDKHIRKGAPGVRRHQDEYKRVYAKKIDAFRKIAHERMTAQAGKELEAVKETQKQAEGMLRASAKVAKAKMEVSKAMAKESPGDPRIEKYAKEGRELADHVLRHWPEVTTRTERLEKALKSAPELKKWEPPKETGRKPVKGFAEAAAMTPEQQKLYDEKHKQYTEAGIDPETADRLAKRNVELQSETVAAPSASKMTPKQKFEQEGYDAKVKDYAESLGVDESTYKSMEKDAWDEKRKHHDMVESARKRASKLTGIGKSDITYRENRPGGGLDHSSIRHWDVSADQIKNEFPELGWSDDTAEEAMWNLIKDGPQSLPTRDSDEYHDVVAEYIQEHAGGRQSDPIEDPYREEDFRQTGRPELYSALLALCRQAAPPRVRDQTRAARTCSVAT